MHWYFFHHFIIALPKLSYDIFSRIKKIRHLMSALFAFCLVALAAVLVAIVLVAALPAALLPLSAWPKQSRIKHFLLKWVLTEKEDAKDASVCRLCKYRLYSIIIILLIFPQQLLKNRKIPDGICLFLYLNSQQNLQIP